MMKEHCDHCDSVIEGMEHGNRRPITIGLGYNVNASLTLLLDGKPQKFCDHCLNVAATAFADRGRIPIGGM